MEIKPKYNIGDSYYTIYAGKLVDCVINGVTADVTKTNTLIKYRVQMPNSSGLTTIPEKRIFMTKLECVYSWIEEQQLEPGEVLQGFLHQKKLKERNETN